MHEKIFSVGSTHFKWYSKGSFPFDKYFLGKSKNDQPNIFDKIVTDDDTWFYKYDPETKQHSLVCKPEEANPPAKAR